VDDRQVCLGVKALIIFLIRLSANTVFSVHETTILEAQPRTDGAGASKRAAEHALNGSPTGSGEGNSKGRPNSQLPKWLKRK